jgi:hypothetical protein
MELADSTTCLNPPLHAASPTPAAGGALGDNHGRRDRVRELIGAVGPRG